MASATSGLRADGQPVNPGEDFGEGRLATWADPLPRQEQTLAQYVTAEDLCLPRSDAAPTLLLRGPASSSRPMLIPLRPALLDLRLDLIVSRAVPCLAPPLLCHLPESTASCLQRSFRPASALGTLHGPEQPPLSWVLQAVWGVLLPYHSS